FQFVVDRKRQALALRAVSQCRVVQEHVPHPSRRSVRDIKSGAASRLLERPRRASSGPTARQPSASPPPLRWSRMVMLVMDRLAQRTLMAVILTPARGASIPRPLRSRPHGPAPPHRPPPSREARDPPPPPARRARSEERRVGKECGVERGELEIKKE